ncbi:MAG TPA: hypothetical protein PK440_19800 [Candidatus Accumulibacter phosphatis]|nr:hypothetical protein [Accumulibacter sp.]HCN66756.1 hypothetical protein [Accumulibacter sp.]HRQ97209.1 hypothetical protein [Candidatus Accumulibacter phosphatis]
MSPLRITARTVLTTLLAGAALAVAWLHVRSLEIPRLARVDIGSLVARQQQALGQRVQPGMTVDEQARLFEEAKTFGVQLDAALDQVAQECRCALLNSAALVKASSAVAIPDLTARVAELVGPSSHPATK